MAGKTRRPRSKRNPKRELKPPSTKSAKSAAPSRKPNWRLPLALLLLGLVLRGIFAHDLPLNMDEESHLELARKISIQPGDFHLPLGSEKTNHPILVVYVTALADWAGSGSVPFIRAVFVLLSLIGLVGIYQLTRTFFGERAGLFALALAATDHHLISYAPQFLEPVYLNLAPWIILAFHRAVAEDRNRQWLVVGALFGVAFLITEIIVLLTVPLALFVLASRKVRSALKSPWFYGGLGLFFLIVSPYLIWSFLNESANIGRHADRAGNFGISPRTLLLYLGGLLICFKDISWIYLSIGHEMYSPVHIPSHWLTGLAYVACVLYSLRFFRDLRYAILLLVFFAIGLTVTVLNAREPWNEIGWASMTVFPAIALTGAAASRLWDSFAGKVSVSSSFFVLTFISAAFAFGPGFGYETPSWERRFLGRVIPSVRPREIADQAEKTLETHPDCLMAWFCLMRKAPELERRRQAAREIERLDPRLPMYVMDKASQIWNTGDRSAAVNLMRSLVDEGRRSHLILRQLVLMEFDMENYSEAIDLSRTLLEIKPDVMSIHQVLYLTLIKTGKMEEAKESLDALLRKNYVNDYEGYTDLAKWLSDAGEAERALAFAEKTLSIKPDFVKGHVTLGMVLEKSGRGKEALKYYTQALDLEPDSTLALEHLAKWHLQRGHNDEALDLYRRTLECAEAQGKDETAERIRKLIDNLPGK